LSSRRAGAPILVHHVDAGASVLAGVGDALVNLLLAVHPLVTGTTGAGVGAQPVPTLRAVLARRGRTFVDLLGAVAAPVPGGTVAVVAVAGVHAGAAVLAQVSKRNTWKIRNRVFSKCQLPYQFSKKVCTPIKEHTPDLGQVLDRSVGLKGKMEKLKVCISSLPILVTILCKSANMQVPRI